jgi:hypothetical protein
VVLVLLTPHPKGGEHFSAQTFNLSTLTAGQWHSIVRRTQEGWNTGSPSDQNMSVFLPLLIAFSEVLPCFCNNLFCFIFGNKFLGYLLIGIRREEKNKKGEKSKIIIFSSCFPRTCCRWWANIAAKTLALLFA